MVVRDGVASQIAVEIALGGFFSYVFELQDLALQHLVLNGLTLEENRLARQEKSPCRGFHEFDLVYTPPLTTSSHY